VSRVGIPIEEEQLVAWVELLNNSSITSYTVDNGVINYSPANPFDRMHKAFERMSEAAERVFEGIKKMVKDASE